MSKPTQKELLDEAFWDKFKPALKQGKEAIKSAANLLAPEVAGPMKTAWQGVKDFGTRITNAGIPMEQQVERWVQEQGRWPISHARKTGKYPDGTEHFSLKISEKGINKRTGKEGPGRLYREPQAIVAYDPKKKDFAWRVRPRSDTYLKKNGVTRYGSEDYRPDNDSETEFDNQEYLPSSTPAVPPKKSP